MDKSTNKSESNTCSLIFNNYVVDEINFRANSEFKSNEFNLEMNINKNIKYTDSTKMEVYLKLDLFNEKDINLVPFKMNIVITGYFEIQNNTDNINFEPNAIAILYPYLRAIVSTYTASANINPVILPAINVLNLFNDNQ